MERDKKLNTRWKTLHRALAAAALLAILGPPAAAQGGDASLSVRPFARVRPAAIRKPAVRIESGTGGARLEWAAPQVFPGSDLDRYQIRVQTTSPVDVGEDMEKWWSLRGGALLQGLYGEAPGDAVVRTLGPSRSNHQILFPPGRTYYIAVRSADDVGAEFDYWSEASPAAEVEILSGTKAPQRPGMVTGELSRGGTFTLRWRPVTADVTGRPIAISYYLVERFGELGAALNASFQVPGAQSFYGERVEGQVWYYRVTAVSTNGLSSEPSALADSTGAGNLYVLADDDPTTRVVIPPEAAFELGAENNAFGEDVTLELTRRAGDETGSVTRSYELSARLVSSDQRVTGLTFLRTPVAMQLGYSSLLNAPRPARSLSREFLDALEQAGTDPAAVTRILKVYWSNGREFVPVDHPTVTEVKSLSVDVRNLGIYQLRTASQSGALRLAAGSPYPRVIAPNDPAENNRVFFFLENPDQETLSGAIYDLRGAKVADLSINSLSPTPSCLVWDGRDNGGNIVPSGVYLYEIKAGQDRPITGTVVVAR